MKLSIATTEEIFRLRNILQQISHISFTFASVNKKYPLDTLSEEQGKEILEVYKNLIKEAETIFSNLNQN